MAGPAPRRRGVHPHTGVPLAVYAVRRRLLIARLRAQAASVGATVEVDIHPRVFVEAGVRVRAWPGTHSVIRLARGVRVQRGVDVQLKGGRLRVDEHADIRTSARLSVGGELWVGPRAFIGFHNVVHCANRVVVGEMSGLAEGCTLVDSNHTHVGPDAWWYHEVVSGTVEVGRNTWLAAKSTLVRNARVGDCCIVAANTVVTGEVPDGHRAAGNPATITPLGYPWIVDTVSPPPTD